MLLKDNQFLIIAGPCSLESEAISFAVAEVIKKVQEELKDTLVIFKGSFDKANRTSGKSSRGMGLDEGLELLQKVKTTFGLPVTTDIHLPEQANAIGEICDVVQIPAFLCRQTDLLTAAAHTKRVVNVKKGQFLAPTDMQYVVQKLQQANASEIWQCERGTTFGYNNLVVDMRGIPIMQKNNCPVVLDATHSVQLPGAQAGASGGQAEFIDTLAFAGIAAGANGIFLETHPDPLHAISDPQTQLPLNKFYTLIVKCYKLFQFIHHNN